MNEIKAGIMAGILTILPIFIANLPIHDLPLQQYIRLMPLLGIYILAYYLLLKKD